MMALASATPASIVLLLIFGPPLAFVAAVVKTRHSLRAWAVRRHGGQVATLAVLGLWAGWVLLVLPDSSDWSGYSFVDNAASFLQDIDIDQPVGAFIFLTLFHALWIIPAIALMVVWWWFGARGHTEDHLLKAQAAYGDAATAEHDETSEREREREEDDESDEEDDEDLEQGDESDEEDDEDLEQVDESDEEDDDDLEQVNASNNEADEAPDLRLPPREGVDGAMPADVFVDREAHIGRHQLLSTGVYGFRLSNISSFHGASAYTAMQRTDDVFGISVTLNITEGPGHVGMRQQYPLCLHTDKAWSAARRFVMAALGLPAGQQGDAEFMQKYGDGDWSFSVTNGSVGELWASLDGRTLKARVDQRLGPRDGEMRQTYIWLPA